MQNTGEVWATAPHITEELCLQHTDDSKANKMEMSVKVSGL